MLKYYPITDTAESEYRSGAKRCNRMNLNRDLIERRLNALISVSKDVFYFSDDDFEAGIFSCIITVTNNKISGIRWCNESHHSKTNRQTIESLKAAYQKYGLNKYGERIIDLAS